MRNFPKSKTTVFWIAPFNQPTKTKILNLVRLNSPVSLDTMFATLTQQGFLVPTKQHLSKTIDRFRKENLIIRRKDGGFIPVSYTHLDVYKRQQFDQSIDIINGNIELSRISIELAKSLHSKSKSYINEIMNARKQCDE